MSFLRGLKKFNVPNGICLPTKTFEKLINDNNALHKAIADINVCVTSLQHRILKKTCEFAVQLFLETAPDKELQLLIKVSKGAKIRNRYN